jgi:predicted nuclease of predicted toxin-antitoxin system
VKIVGDESVDRQIVIRLRSDGHVVTYIAELDPGIDDDVVLLLAQQTGSLLLTADKDFGDLVFRLHRAHNGVLLVRLQGLDPERKADLVATTLAEHSDELADAFAVLSKTSLRVRRVYS